MRIGYGLNIEQQQKLIMTPELRQAITILQLSSMELAEYIENELLENPLLEVKEEEKEFVEDNLAEGKETKEEEKFDIDWQEYFQDRSDLGYQKPKDEEAGAFEHFVSEGPTLSEHLLLQLNLLSLSAIEYKIGEYLIGNIDEGGYLRASVEEAASQLQVAKEEVEGVLGVIQAFEPYGVGARDLKECLLIQLQFLREKPPFMEEFVIDFLEDLAEGRVQKIATHFGLSLQEIQKAADLLKTLEPKPGRLFSGPNETKYIISDVVVEKIGAEYIVLVNDTTTPRLNINKGYRDLLLKKDNLQQEAKKFVEDKLNSASWLIKSIEQRRLTMYKVASCLVELQRDFLEHGVKELKPLTLKQVAELVGLHESTVSRATSNKYIQTPQGVFEMKYFFSSGVEDQSGAGVSSESIKRTIREMIDRENAKKPLSDQKITDLLVEQGINISRRTVAKYRDELGIMAAVKRKRY